MRQLKKRKQKKEKAMVYMQCNRAGDALDSAFRMFFENDWDAANRIPVRMDVVQEKDGFKILVELPGMEKDQIKITAENGILTISGERKRREDDSAQVVRSERFYGSFSRSFTLPETIDKSGISADYVNGLLEVTLPLKEAEKPRQIDIAVN